MTGNDKNTQVEETNQPDPMTLILQMRNEMEMLKKKKRGRDPMNEEEE